MVQLGSILQVSDNSGAKRAQFIRKIKASASNIGFIGDKIIVTVVDYIAIGKQKTKITLRKKMTKGQVHMGVIIRTKWQTHKDSYSTWFGDNALVLVKSDNYLFTRIIGPVSSELRLKG